MEDRPARPWVGELAPVLPIAALEVVGSWLAGHHQTGVRHYDVGGALLLAAGAAALAGRRRQPAAVLAVVLGTTLAYAAADYPDGPIFLALVVAFANAVLTGHRRAAWASLAVGYPSFLLADTVLHHKPGPGLAAAVGLAAWLIALATAAEVVRARRERGIEAIRTREEEARRRAGEERMRIARELHDVLAHDISLINVQAGVALHLMDEQPEQARTALTAIHQASKDAVGELRSVLEVLRQVDEGEPRAPTAGLDHLDRLVAGATAAGLDVRVQTDGQPRPLPPSVDLAAFRIIQEALTNVTRHAGRATATISLTYGEHALDVQVDDDGHGAANGSGGGNGILGMKERAAALAGELQAGPRPGGGFRVRASLPLDAARGATGATL
jgi:signal transduction histidine kinase